jgi:hypothetical protein
MRKLLGVLLFCPWMLAQVSTGSLAITMSVAPAVSLALQGPSTGAFSLGSGSVVRVVVRRTQAEGPESITLLARGNTAYSLTASLVSVAGGDPSGATVAITPQAPAPTGGRVMTQASTATATPAMLAWASGPAVIVAGSRVSRGGNDQTPDNALAIPLRVDLPSGATEAALLFRITAQ